MKTTCLSNVTSGKLSVIKKAGRKKRLSERIGVFLQVAIRQLLRFSQFFPGSQNRLNIVLNL